MTAVDDTEPLMIRSEEQLSDLPIGSVVITVHGGAAQKLIPGLWSYTTSTGGPVTSAKLWKSQPRANRRFVCVWQGGTA